MYNSALMAVQEQGAKIIMMDGTIWIIKPEDIIITKDWEPPNSMQIKETSIDKEFDYLITNQESNQTVSAQKRR